ncbi:MAG TPA: GGDEF domain-containing protein [Oxalicibacterium sp.]|uniref:GGDEF domain-containing protein n=1 Tax=Oxalicibacterium sp. TaxID=2766525 RepID=UPI002B609D49|nr:GGDEF domain-containing protein [Oxalicibacterium sp.]HWU97796.1 GGDEF domain-containing protein [Oxalicibacterium sp.]
MSGSARTSSDPRDTLQGKHHHHSAQKIHVVLERRRSAGHANQQGRQAARIRRLVLNTAFAGLYLLAIGVFYLMGLVELFVLKVATAMIGVSFSVFYLSFATGLNLKTRTQNLRIPLTLSAIGIMLTIGYIAPVTQILLTPFLFLTMAFVMHRVSPKEMLWMSLAVLGAYALVVFAHFRERGDTQLLMLECALLLALALTLPSFAMLAGRVQRLHSALFQANRKIRDIEQDAQRDALLGCYNRRYIVAALEQQKRMADETGAPLCLAVIDLDHFKRVNDEAGHLGGDEVLRSFAGIAERNVRQRDIFGRYGGEEFLLVLPETSLLAALNIAERIRAQVEQHEWSAKLQNRVTVSIGLTQHIPGESVLDLFSRTDTAMYMAKQGGRNQVVVEEPAGDAALT